VVPNRRRRLRLFSDWLARNEIYFRITGGFLVTVCLSLTSVLIAYQANRIAEQQTRLTTLQTQLAARQTTVMQAQLLPFIRVTPQFHTREKPYAGEQDVWLVVSNKGGPLDELKVAVGAFLRAAGSESPDIARLYWPLLYLNDDCMLTGEDSGVVAIVTAQAYGCSWSAWCREGESGPFLLEFYVSVSYVDGLREKHTDVFHVCIDWRRRWGHTVESHLEVGAESAEGGASETVIRILRSFGVPASLAGRVVDMFGLEVDGHCLSCQSNLVEEDASRAYVFERICLDYAPLEALIAACRGPVKVWNATPFEP